MRDEGRGCALEAAPMEHPRRWHVPIFVEREKGDDFARARRNRRRFRSGKLAFRRTETRVVRDARKSTAGLIEVCVAGKLSRHTRR